MDLRFAFTSKILLSKNPCRAATCPSVVFSRTKKNREGFFGRLKSAYFLKLENIIHSFKSVALC